MGAEIFPLRHIIVTIEKDSGITVLYGDTDSLFIKNPTEEQIVVMITVLSSG